VTILIAAIRAIHFASLMALFGGSAFAALLRRARLLHAPDNAIRVLGLAEAILALVSAIGWFCLVAGEMSGDWQGSLDPAVLRLAASGTRFGQIFGVRIIGLCALCCVCFAWMRSNSVKVPIFAGLLLASLAPVSHAAAGDGDAVTIGTASDAAHLLAGGFWLGGLVVLALIIFRLRPRPAGLVGPLRVFSFWASLAVALLVFTGSINLLLIVPVADMSLRNPYFALLLVKIGLAAVMIGLAGLNRWRFTAALASGDEWAVRPLASSVGLETVLAFLVAAIVGYLGTMAPH
jgi:putative copper resistance protein D